METPLLFGSTMRPQEQEDCKVMITPIPLRESYVAGMLRGIVVLVLIPVVLRGLLVATSGQS